MSYTIDRLITGAAFDAVDSRTRVALAAVTDFSSGSGALGRRLSF